MGGIVVGIGECKVSGNRSDELVTYALGSCIGVGMVDVEAGVGGLLHFLLPDSSGHTERRERNPEAFADTGIRLLVERLRRAGGDMRRMRVRLAGGAQMLTGDALQIGRRNHLAARKTLWQLGLLVEMEAVGGSQCRNLGLRIGSGEFWVKAAGGDGRER